VNGSVSIAWDFSTISLVTESNARIWNSRTGCNRSSRISRSARSRRSTVALAERQFRAAARLREPTAERERGQVIGLRLVIGWRCCSRPAAAKATEKTPRATRTGVHADQESASELRAKLRAINAQTPRKTEEHQRPKSKTNQQDRELREICKTSIPGSNPGGASNLRWSIPVTWVTDPPSLPRSWPMRSALGDSTRRAARLWSLPGGSGQAGNGRDRGQDDSPDAQRGMAKRAHATGRRGRGQPRGVRVAAPRPPRSTRCRTARTPSRRARRKRRG
jgi:hypothetical protein